MSRRAFSVTYDYRCPFARNAHEHLVAALRGGADWDVEFTPFSLSQVHVEEGGVPVWDDPAKAPDLLAIEAGLVVRDTFPDALLRRPRRRCSPLRHDRGLDLRDESVIRDVLAASGVDGDAVLRGGGRRRSARHLPQGARGGGDDPPGLRRPDVRDRRQRRVRAHHDPARRRRPGGARPPSRAFSPCSRNTPSSTSSSTPPSSADGSRRCRQAALFSHRRALFSARRPWPAHPEGLASARPRRAFRRRLPRTPSPRPRRSGRICAVTSSSLPTTATSAGPAAPSRSNMAR